MERVKRNERIGVIMQTLSRKPSQVVPLSYFCELFGVAKSSVSEDIDLAQATFERYGLGEISTVAGAAGGVFYRPRPKKEAVEDYLSGLCRRINEPSRILPGGLLYMMDFLFNPVDTQTMGEIIAAGYAHVEPGAVVTMETKGIPVAMMTARFLNVPLIICRRDNKITEGAVLTINYVSGSSDRTIRTMSLAKRLVSGVDKALIVDDFMRGGGTAKGMHELMAECGIEVVGTAVIIETEEPAQKLVNGCRALLKLKSVDEEHSAVHIIPAWNI
jgi:purine operon repressor